MVQILAGTVFDMLFQKKVLEAEIRISVYLNRTGFSDSSTYNQWTLLSSRQKDVMSYRRAKFPAEKNPKR